MSTTTCESAATITLPREQILNLLPYGSDFLFLDRAMITKGRSITAEMSYRADDRMLQAHFRGGPPVVPGAILAEQISQAALLLAILSEKVLAGQPFVVGRLRCKFSNPAVADCTVTVTVEFELVTPPRFAFRGFAECGGERLAEVELIAALREF